MHAKSFADVVGRKPVALLFATPQLCQSRVCGPVVDVALADEGEVRRPRRVHPPGGLRGQRPEQGPARAAAALQPADGAVAVRRRARTAGSRHGWRGPSGSAPSSGRSRPHCDHRLRPRARAALEPADPGVAVRVGGGDRALRLVRRAGGAVAEAAARAPGLAAAARRARARQPRRRGRGRRDRRRDPRARARHGLRRAADAAGQLRPHLRLHHLLGRAGVRERAVRRPLPPLQPVAGDRARAVPRPRAAALPGAARALARRDRPARLHVDRARLGLGRAPRDARDRGGRLQRRSRSPRWRSTASSRGRAAGETFSVYFNLFSRLSVFETRGPRRRRAAAARRPAAAGPGRRHGRARRRDDRHRHLRRAEPGPALEGPRRAAQRRAELARGRDRDDAEDRRHDRAADRRRDRRRLLHARDRGRALGRGRPRRRGACAAASSTASCRSRWSTSPPTT